MIVKVTMTIKCDDCGVHKTWNVEQPGIKEKDPAGEDGWVLSEAADRCPPCLKKENDRISGKG